MPRQPCASIPSLSRHKASGQAIVFLRNRYGVRRTYYCGAFGSDEAKATYQRLLGAWIAADYELPDLKAKVVDGPPLTISALADRYVKYAEGYYRRADRTPTGESESIRRALQFLKEQCGALNPAAFSPRKLRELRDVLVTTRYRVKVDKETGKEVPGSGTPLGRKYVNSLVARVRRMFKWAESEELVPAATFHRLATLEQLQIGRSGARETPGLGPVSQQDVDAVLPHLSPQVATLVRFAWVTGCRMGEAVQLCSRQVDMSGSLWVFRPAQHKNLHREKPRSIYIGEAGQKLLRPWVQLDPDRAWFRPVDAESAFRATKREHRATPFWPSHRKAQERKRSVEPKRRPGETYDTHAVARAITRACKRARVAPWSPHRLRHSALGRIRKEMGIEAASAVAGHTTLTMVERYSVAARETLAVEAMKRLG